MTANDVLPYIYQAAQAEYVLDNVSAFHLAPLCSYMDRTTMLRSHATEPMPLQNSRCYGIQLPPCPCRPYSQRIKRFNITLPMLPPVPNPAYKNSLQNPSLRKPKKPNKPGWPVKTSIQANRFRNQISTSSGQFALTMIGNESWWCYRRKKIGPIIYQKFEQMR